MTEPTANTHNLSLNLTLGITGLLLGGLTLMTQPITGLASHQTDDEPLSLTSSSSDLSLTDVQRPLLKRVMARSDDLYRAMKARRLADAQLHAGAVAQAARSLQGSFINGVASDSEAAGALALVFLSAEQIAFTHSIQLASAYFKDLSEGLITLNTRYPELLEGRSAQACQSAQGGRLTWLSPAQEAGSPYLHEVCR